MKAKFTLESSLSQLNFRYRRWQQASYCLNNRLSGWVCFGSWRSCLWLLERCVGSPVVFTSFYCFQNFSFFELLPATSCAYASYLADIQPIKGTQNALLSFLVTGIEGDFGSFAQQQSLRIMSKLSEYNSIALDLVDRGILDGLAAALDQSNESPWNQKMLMTILANLCKHGTILPTFSSCWRR